MPPEGGRGFRGLGDAAAKARAGINYRRQDGGRNILRSVRVRRPVADPPVLSLLESGGEAAAPGRWALRALLERCAEVAAKRPGLVVGEAEPGRYLLVMIPKDEAGLKAEIDAGVDLVLARLGIRWPSPHISHFGLREEYKGARERWLRRNNMETLVQNGQLGVVTIFCHDWIYSIAGEVAGEHGLRVDTPFQAYLETGKLRLAGTNAFQVDVLANVREMAAEFLPIDHLVAKLLVVAAVSKDETLAAKVAGRPCAACGARVAAGAAGCPACGAKW